MKLTQTLFLILFINFGFAQNIEKITIPKRVVYNYANDKTNQKAKELIEESLLQKDNFKLLGENLIVGPTLWKKFQNIETLKSIPGNVIFHIDNLEVDGKNCQILEDSKKIWIEVKKEINEKYIIRKANEDELDYYWSTISFDIEEPLYIIETDQHKYILNFIEKDLKLFWIDEYPNKKTYENPIDKNVYKTDGEFKRYQNGEEVYLTSKGEKETKLEKVVFLSSDSELKENTSIEDLKKVIDKTNVIFESLFKGSEKSGKIMIQFELGKKKNEIQFAVRDDLDLDIMKEFEKQVNSKKYPNSKKEPIKIQLIYKVNSLNDTE